MIITAQEDKNDDDQPKSPSDNGLEEKPKEPEGDLILDATCTPADIHYPTDITLLNDAREIPETVIEKLHEPVVGIHHKKPRDYRQRARRDFLNFIEARANTGRINVRRWK